MWQLTNVYLGVCGIVWQIISALCNFVQPVNLAKGQHVFEEGSRGKEMYMLIQGELEVTQQGERLGFLSDGAFFVRFLPEPRVLASAVVLIVRHRLRRARSHCLTASRRSRSCGRAPWSR